MTIYGTPGGTPLNTTPFQGTQPGNPVQASLSFVSPAVGLFPPNSDTRSGDTIMASISRATAPANVKLTNALLGSTPAGRALVEVLADGGAQGTSINPGGGGWDSMNISANGGGGTGAGGMNQDLGSNAGRSSQLATPTPSSVIVTATPPQYQG
jgi:hypothetical protein